MGYFLTKPGKSKINEVFFGGQFENISIIALPSEQNVKQFYQDIRTRHPCTSIQQNADF